LHDASRQRCCLANCNLAVHHVEGIHLKLRNITDGTLYAKDRGRGSKLKKRSSCMGDAAYIIGLIGFFILCALYVAALDRI
jgi:hypothetical protein